MKSPVVRFVGMAVWLITSLVALALGLKVFGYNFLETGFLSRYATPVGYVVLVAAVLSLIMFVMSLSGSCGCGCCDHNHDDKRGSHNHR